MAKIVSFLRCSTFVLIVGLVLSNSLIFSKASFAQTVTPRSTVTLSKNSKLVQSQAGFYRMTIGDIKVTRSGHAGNASKIRQTPQSARRTEFCANGQRGTIRWRAYLVLRSLAG